VTDDKRRPIDRIELPPGISRDELLADIGGMRDRLLRADIERDLLRSPRDELRADIEGLRSLRRTGQELRSNARRQHIARTIAAAEKLSEMILGDKVAPEARLGVQYLRFRQNVLSLIDELKKDDSPAVVELLDINQNISQLENMIDVIADRYRHYFDAEPGSSLSPTTAEVGGPFIRFAEALLAEVYEVDKSPNRPAAIKAALYKLRRLRRS
jgi:hypothetical protein